MREIKFRTWDKKEKRFIEDVWIRNNVAMLNKNFAEDDWIPNEYPDVEISQFTGLKDRKGKEIYEGDIVKSEQWTPEIYRVWFSRGGFCFSNDTTDIEYVNDAKYLEQFEVIGNIYENPELLK